METERILLRHWLESDAEALFKYASDPDVGPRAGWPAHKSVEESREIIRTFFNNDTTWAIVLKETGEAIGCIGYYTHETSNIPIGENDCEVGYWVGKPYWNKGICTEALKLMLDYCINEKHFENIWADHFTGNPASGRVMEKCGFIDTGMLNKCSQLVGGDKDMVKVFKYKGLKKMRKKSRAMDSEWALEIMHKAPYITVSFIDEDGKPYGFPLSLASDDDVNWYFHGALEGKKLEAIKTHPEICLSAVTRCAPTVGPKDGSFTLQFKSAIAFGKAEIVNEDTEKIHGLRLISERFLPKHMDAFDQSIARSLSRTAVVRITLTEPPTGKRKQYDKEGVEMKYGRME